ncbi:uncharacterized protein [Drosophila suzukii]|uniref:Uncharacterized protein n=1 Tax=Drosophila suzukii TaxID=28584 RepID=A0ABM4TW09_DROSZ
MPQGYPVPSGQPPRKLVIAGLVPVEELVREAVEVEETVTTTDYQTMREARRPARERSISRWQERWDSATSGPWTHAIIPVLSPWLDFYLNQILSGHGRFRPYLKKYGHDTSDGSGIEEDARHVRFVEDRTVLNTATGVSTSPSTLVPTMLRGQVEWDATAKFAASVMRKLRIAEREKSIGEALLCGRTAQLLQFTPIFFS